MPIRPATLRDLAPILQLEAQCFPPGDAFPRRTWRYLLTRPTARVLVATRRRECAGVIVGLHRKGSRVFRIYSVAVSPRHRGHGIATQLLRTLIRRRKKDTDTISLEVREDNLPARRFYEKHGFRPVQILPQYYADGATGIRYHCTLR